MEGSMDCTLPHWSSYMAKFCFNYLFDQMLMLFSYENWKKKSLSIFFRATFETYKGIKFHFWSDTIPCKMGDWGLFPVSHPPWYCSQPEVKFDTCNASNWGKKIDQGFFCFYLFFIIIIIMRTTWRFDQANKIDNSMTTCNFPKALTKLLFPNFIFRRCLCLKIKQKRNLLQSWSHHNSLSLNHHSH